MNWKRLNWRVVARARAKRLFDLTLLLTVIPFFCLPMLLVACMVRLSSDGPVLHWSKRVGRGNKIFHMPKFRSMRLDSPVVATHLLSDSKIYLTPIGSFLRRSSLDELPQLWSILRGEMSFVGPRPALFNQEDLIELRSKYGIHTLLPGLTGWAQVCGRDTLSIQDKVKLDREYQLRQSLWLDIRILLRTIVQVLKGNDVAH
jgi:O-antigen biosynthesis protein WbqP